MDNVASVSPVLDNFSPPNGAQPSVVQLQPSFGVNHPAARQFDPSEHL